MNENPQKSNTPNSSEEVDLGQLFNVIGNAFNKLMNFIASIFKAIFSVIIYTLRAVIVNIKVIIVVMILAGVLGYVLEHSKPKIYSSSMLVRPYFESKFQLVTNMSYYNALLNNQNYKTVATIFNISEEDAKQINGFEISPGPETENDKIVQYDRFVKSIDSVRAQEISFEEYIENRSIYSGDLFEITVYSKKNDIFTNLELGLNKSFTNAYSTKRMEKRDSLITIQKNNIIAQLTQVDALQKIYINVLEQESQSQATEFSIGGEGFSLSKDKSNTREFDLLNKEIELRNQLRALEEKKVDEDVFFDVISSFQKVGKNVSHWYERYSILFPIFAFILLCIIYLTRKIVIYVKNYEA
ncbi:hypothetical protein SAMN04487989_101634 [Bizionia echini]|uniref:Chain length determinant protein n=1 Tax=Bizionia echini TaxID=649333 RepID=A0A1I4Z922_9FLAO|nr:hypothetical protein [Bizionia echini]SFN46792.1 hypothetical protein SAMN04487989_101634 [Bizionia echini]